MSLYILGPTMSLALANSGLTSFEKLEEANPREIEVVSTCLSLTLMLAQPGLTTQVHQLSTRKQTSSLCINAAESQQIQTYIPYLAKLTSKGVSTAFLLCFSLYPNLGGSLAGWLVSTSGS